MQDPYEAVKEEVVRSVTKLETSYRRWKSTEDPTQLQQQKGKLLEAIKIIEGDLNDLSDSIKVIKGNRQKFGGVTDETLEARVKFIEDTQVRLSQIKEDVLQHHSQVMAKEQAKKPGAKGAKAQSPYAYLQEEADTQQFINSHMQAQAEIEEEQDEALEDLTHAVKRLKVTGTQITDELRLHDKVIEDIDTEMNTLQGKMKAASRQLEKAMDEASQKTKLCCIFILIIILVVVTWLLFAL